MITCSFVLINSLKFIIDSTRILNLHLPGFKFMFLDRSSFKWCNDTKSLSDIRLTFDNGDCCCGCFSYYYFRCVIVIKLSCFWCSWYVDFLCFFLWLWWLMFNCNRLLLLWSLFLYFLMKLLIFLKISF